MKRMIAFLIIFVMMLGVKFVQENNLPRYDYEKLIVVTKLEKLFDAEKIENGNQFYFIFDNNRGEKVLKELNIENIDGLVYYFDKNLGVDFIKNKLDFYYEAAEKIDELEIYYGFDSSYPNFTYLNGKKINVQIVKNSTNIIVGYPMILCGY